LLKLFAGSNLAGKKKGFGILALTAQFEGTEFFVPRPCGYIRLGLQPDPQLVEIVKIMLRSRMRSIR
jgi:hypothetical protein